MLQTKSLDNLNIKVSDFGFLSIAEKSTTTYVDSNTIGSQTKEEKEKRDIKSIGEIVFQLLTGENFTLPIDP